MNYSTEENPREDEEREAEETRREDDEERRTEQLIEDRVFDRQC